VFYGGESMTFMAVDTVALAVLFLSVVDLYIQSRDWVFQENSFAFHLPPSYLSIGEVFWAWMKLEDLVSVSAASLLVTYQCPLRSEILVDFFVLVVFIILNYKALHSNRPSFSTFRQFQYLLYRIRNIPLSRYFSFYTLVFA
jgi:hypothetical protein